MVFDFFNGGELYHYLSEGGKFGEERARFYTAEITLALGYLHDRGIVYRDLKVRRRSSQSQLAPVTFSVLAGDSIVHRHSHPRPPLFCLPAAGESDPGQPGPHPHRRLRAE